MAAPSGGVVWKGSPHSPQVLAVPGFEAEHFGHLMVPHILALR